MNYFVLMETGEAYDSHAEVQAFATLEEAKGYVNDAILRVKVWDWKIIEGVVVCKM